MTQSSWQTLVVGAGISGLSFGHIAARRGKRVLILESSGEVGGCLHTHFFERRPEFWCELGAHTLYNSYGGLLEIVDELDLAGAMEPKEKLPYKMLVNGSTTAVASRLHWGELLRSLPRILSVPKTGKTVGEYYAAIAGQRNFSDVLEPAFNAVLCQPAGNFPAEALFRKRQRRKDRIKHFTFTDGVQQIAREIARQSKLTVRTGTQAASIVSQGQEGFRVVTQSGEEIHTEDLILAVPPDAAALMLGSMLPELSALLGRISMANIKSLAVAVDGMAVRLPRLAGLIGVNQDFYSVVSRDPRPHPEARGFTFHFRPDQSDTAARLKRASEVLGVGVEQIQDQFEYVNRIPSYAPDHYSVVQNIDAALSGLRLGLIGNYFLGVSIEDCIGRSRREYERLYGLL